MDSKEQIRDIVSKSFDQQPICDFVGIINPKYTDMNNWINFVLDMGKTDKWSFTKNNNNSIPQVGDFIAVISTCNIKHTINVNGSEQKKHFLKTVYTQ